MTSSLMVIAAAEEVEQARELPMPTYMYGLLAMAIFLFLLLVTYAFRSIHTRHS